VCLMGNINTSLMAIGNPESVEEATKEVIAKAGKHGHLLVSGGCGLSANVPPENMSAMIKAAKEVTLLLLFIKFIKLFFGKNFNL